jgi:hypothetical protein
VYVKAYRGFESHPVRLIDNDLRPDAALLLRAAFGVVYVLCTIWQHLRAGFGVMRAGPARRELRWPGDGLTRRRGVCQLPTGVDVEGVALLELPEERRVVDGVR